MGENKLTISQSAECSNFIQCHPIFTYLPNELVEELCSRFTAVNVERGEVIVKQNEVVDSIYYIARGEAEVTRNFLNSIPTDVAILSRCDTIGLSVTGVYSPDLKRSATVTALTDMLLFKLSLGDLNDFMIKNNDYADYIQAQSLRLTKFHFLKHIDLFANLPSDILFLIAKKLQTLSVPANTLLFREDESGADCYLLQTGKVLITQKGKPVATLEAPSIFGEAALLTGKLRNASAITITPCQLLVLSKEMLLEISSLDFVAADALTEVMLSRQKENRGFHLTKQGWLVFKNDK